MVVSLRVTPTLAKPLAQIRDLGPEKLGAVLARIEAERLPIVSRKGLRALVEKDLEQASARAVTDQLIALAIFGRRQGIDHTEVLESLTDGLKQTGWAEEELKAWANVRSTLSSLIGSRLVKIVAKAVDLGRDYQSMLDSVRILTDVRPVFDDPREKIIGGIVTQTMRVVYFGSDGEHSLSVVLDQGDLTDLLKACQVAQAKGKTAQQVFKEQCGLEMVLLGDDADGTG